MNKRLYGVEQIAEAIAKYSDDNLRNETSLFLNSTNGNSIIRILIDNKYGINKEGKVFGKAPSLISKYLYFLNNYNFPIYDSLALTSYKLLRKNIFESKIRIINEPNYFNCMEYLNTITNINNFEKLDNLLWLIGKLSKGSFSILMDQEKYIELIKTDEIEKLFIKSKRGDNTSSNTDGIIRNYIKAHYTSSSLFTENQKIFFEFVFNLK